jgi:hypothetical protein
LGNGGEAMTTYIHYRESDGEIMGWEHGVAEPSSQPDLATAALEDVVTPDPRRQRFDAATLGLIDKDADDIAASLAPTADDLRSRIAGELAATDQFMMPDRPMADEKRAAWVAYRQALRDLSKLSTPAEQLAAWPESPIR